MDGSIPAGAGPGDIVLGERGLELPLPDGTRAYFNYYWLRDNCPTSFDRETRERSYDVFQDPSFDDAGPLPAGARLDGAEADRVLEIVWRESGHVTRHRLDWLAPYASGLPRPDPAELPRRLWYADHYPKIARFSQPALKADRTLVGRWAKALLEDGVAIVTDMPDSDEGLTETCRLLGQVRPTFFGEYFDVRVHADPVNLAYTAKALEMHTDVPAEELAPGVQFLHCRANSVAGGDNLILDGAAVAEDFRRAHSEDFTLLAETEIPFFWEHEGFDIRARQRVIELDRFGAVAGLTISQHLLDAIDLPQALLDRYYPALRRFGRWLRDPKYLVRYRLKAGECVVFDNHRVVHGRDAYVAESGERYLRGTYVDRGELRSTYRAFVSKGRFA
ncbi:MAG: TauD/TfdA family dioxygenase [Bacteroidota bacterium]|nr:TauD/TfdA family dioxygenase [Kiloniellaceae bacterium]